MRVLSKSERDEHKAEVGITVLPFLQVQTNWLQCKSIQLVIVLIIITFHYLIDAVVLVCVCSLNGRRLSRDLRSASGTCECVSYVPNLSTKSLVCFCWLKFYFIAFLMRIIIMQTHNNKRVWRHLSLCNWIIFFAQLKLKFTLHNCEVCMWCLGPTISVSQFEAIQRVDIFNKVYYYQFVGLIFCCDVGTAQ